MAKNIDIPDGWEVKKLGEIFKKRKDKNRDRLINQVLTNSAQYGVIPQEEFFDKSIATKENINNYYILKIDDFIYNPRISKFAPAGPISRNKYGIGCVSPLYTVFRITANYSIDFFESYFKSNIWNKQAYNIANFGARFDRMNITDNDFFNMPILLPPLAEQKKIAEILSLWDKAIQHTKELITYKEKYKKGLMQNLLTGKIRLNGYTDEWKTYKLGEVVEILDSQRIPISREKRTSGIYPYYGANGIVDYINDYIFDGEFLLVGEDGSVINDDKSPVLIWATGKIWVNNHAHVLCEKSCIKLHFLYFYMQTINVSSFVRGLPPKLNQTNLINISVTIPPLDEQKAIADILSSADKEIELLKKQLDLYTEQKKGLMQQLLTGKLRV